MHRLGHILFVCLVLLGVAPVRAADLQPQPFVAPPELSANAALNRSLAFVPASTTSCRPAGDVTRNGSILTLHLVAKVEPNDIRNPGNPANGKDRVALRSFGGCLTGPLIEARPGDTLRLYLDNELDTKDPSCPADASPGPGCFNTINMHFHGLHVSPTGNSDNVLLNIAPHTRFEYEVNIPADHPSGTFWYHPHRHGSTAIGVASGESGALIIRGNRAYSGGTAGDVDTILHNAAGAPMPEKIFLFQQIPYACFTKPAVINKNADKSWKCDPGQVGVVDDFNDQLASPTVWDTSGRFTSINGVVQPTLSVPAGQVERWRFIHAGIHDTINLQIVPMVTSGPQVAQAARGALAGSPKEQEAKLQSLCPSTIPDTGNPAPLVPQFEIATDGITRSSIVPIGLNEKGKSGGIGSNFLQPGYRSDVLITFPHPGTYCMLNQAATPSERANAGGGGQGPNETQLLATIVVTGGQRVSGDLGAFVLQALYDGNRNDPGLPQAALEGLRHGDLSPWRGMPEEGPSTNATNPRTVNFYIGPIDPADPKSEFGFWLNNKSYHPDRVDQTLQVNTTEDWVLTSMVEPHIFHIHVNPFEIMDVKYKGKSIYGPGGECLIGPDSVGLENQYCRDWHAIKDTIFVQNDYQVLIRTTYDRYIGEFVMHCHILDHEDSGMMANILIVPDASQANGGLGMPGMKSMSNGTMTHNM